MLTDKDIGKLASVLATRQEVKEIKDDTEALRESMQALITAVDKLVKPIDDLRMEYAAVSSQLSRHEKWIKDVAKKVGIKLVTD